VRPTIVRRVSVLVTGGAGYIGSHVVAGLTSRGESVVVIDDLSTGVPERVAGLVFRACDLASDGAPAQVEAILREHDIHAVVHLAAKKQVGESAQRPAWYYRENVGGLANLLLAMESARVSNLVFSSSAAVYGNGRGVPARESDAADPINPYGRTKLAGEWMVRDAVRAGWLRAVSLRYFNVAGAGSDLSADRFATNLVPIVFERLIAGEAPRVFGDDYPTPDGTCVRDYVHVVDLADAHVAVLDALSTGRAMPAELNVGTGAGRSVLEVLEMIRDVTGHATTPAIEPRRIGDPAALVADSSLIHAELGWSAKFGLREIITSAWSGFRAPRVSG
jgi:UDP-glucose 4-epimerase